MTRNKILLTTILAVLTIGSATGVYVYKELLNGSYRDDYSLEEVNEKILSFQSKTAEQIEEEMEKYSQKSKPERIRGNYSISIDGDLPFGGGEVELNMDNIDIQYKESKLDFLLENIFAKYDINILGQEQKSELSAEKIHLIAKEEEAYIDIDNLEASGLDTIEGFGDVLGYVQNVFDSNDGYLDLSDNFPTEELFEYFEKGVQEPIPQLDFLLDVLKNENIFVAARQEDTKYYLEPSKTLCKLIKGEKKDDNNMYWRSTFLINEIPENFEDFDTNYASCTQEEHQEVLNAFYGNDILTLEDFYIEIAPLKTHIAINTVLDNQEQGEDNTKMITSFSGVFGLTEMLSMQFRSDIQNTQFEGEGILFEIDKEKVMGYIDVKIPSYNFQANIDINGERNNFNIQGGYNLSLSGEESSSIAKELGNVTASSTLNGKVTDESLDLDIHQNFSAGENQEINGSLNTNIDVSYKDKNYTGNIDFTGELQLAKNSNTMVGDAGIYWDLKQTDKDLKAKYKIDLNVPNIASGNLRIDTELQLGDVESSFETPENILLYDTFSDSIKIKTDKVEKEISMKERDNQRIRDLQVLRMAIEQSYQDEWKYPSPENFQEAIKYYIDEIPQEIYPSYVKNGCNFGYKYEVMPDGVIDNGLYIISSCLESDEMIQKYAKTDGGINPNAMELGIGFKNFTIGSKDIDSLYMHEINQ